MANPVHVYSFASPCRQLFSFPPDVISSMLENPSSPKGLLKLYQTCKYFYSKRQILIVEKISTTGCSKSKNTPPRLTLDDYSKNLLKLRTPIWLTRTANFDGFWSGRIPNLFRSFVQIIHLCESALPYEYFDLLTSKNMVRVFRADRSFIYHRIDKSKVSIDAILEHLPNIRGFAYFIDKTCTIEVLTKLVALKLNYKFDFIELEMMDIHPTFDLNLFCEFIVKNSDDDTFVWLNLHKRAGDKLKLAPQKLDLKWKNVTNAGLKTLVEKVYSVSEEEAAG